MERDVSTSPKPTPIEACTSWACDVVGTACALPCLICGSCLQCGPYDHRAVPQPQQHRGGITDRWYRASVHTVHGGSLLQLVATQSLLWRFPQKTRDTLRIEVAPRNACGDVFAPVVRYAAPTFRVRRLRPDLWSVRLSVRLPCCGGGASSSCDLGASTLNDVWRVSPDGRIVHSLKTRGYQPACAGVTTTCATGPALFVEADSEPSMDEVRRALQDKW